MVIPPAFVWLDFSGQLRNVLRVGLQHPIHETHRLVRLQLVILVPLYRINTSRRQQVHASLLLRFVPVQLGQMIPKVLQRFLRCEWIICLGIKHGFRDVPWNVGNPLTCDRGEAIGSFGGRAAKEVTICLRVSKRLALTWEGPDTYCTTQQQWSTNQELTGE